MKHEDETVSESAPALAAPVIEPRLAGVVLGRGNHTSQQEGMCVMEAVAFIAAYADAYAAAAAPSNLRKVMRAEMVLMCVKAIRDAIDLG